MLQISATQKSAEHSFFQLFSVVLHVWGVKKIVHGLRQLRPGMSGCMCPPFPRDTFLVKWCYGEHPFRWHPLGLVTSELGIQQGDPLGPLLL